MWLRDDQFERIEALLPGKVSDPGCTAVNNLLTIPTSVCLRSQPDMRFRQTGDAINR